jgi:hypothetical protein
MRLRGLLVLAILAALLGAPSIASGAGNTLSSPQVSPGTGTIDTVFTMTVSYDARLPATAVTAAVGGKLLTMRRVAGTPESGTWSARGTLPAGRWAPQFTATDYRGHLATVIGSLVSVIGPALSASAPQPSIISSPTSPQSTDEGVVPVDSDGPLPDAGIAPGGDPALDGGDAPGVDPAPDGGDARGGDPAPDGGDAPGGVLAPGAAPAEDADPDPSADIVPASSPSGAGGSTNDPDSAPRTDAPVTPGSRGIGSSPSLAPGLGVPSAGAVAPSGRPPSFPTSKPVAGAATRTGTDEELRTEDDLLRTVVLVGLAGVAAVALAGTMLLVVARRRSAEGNGEGPGARAAATEALLERRTVARAHVRLDEDPIVAALGIDEEGMRRARRAGGRDSGGRGRRP